MQRFIKNYRWKFVSTRLEQYITDFEQMPVVSVRFIGNSQTSCRIEARRFIDILHLHDRKRPAGYRLNAAAERESRPDLGNIGEPSHHSGSFSAAAPRSVPTTVSRGFSGASSGEASVNPS